MDRKVLIRVKLLILGVIYTLKNLEVNACNEVDTELCLQKTLSRDLMLFSSSPDPNFCRNLDESTARNLIEDAFQCIDTHLSDCDEKDWNSEVYSGKVEMIGQAIERTCNLEFGDHCLGEVTDCMNTNFPSDLSSTFRTQFETADFSSEKLRNNFCREIVYPYEKNYDAAFKCMCKIHSSCNININDSPGYKLSWAGLSSVRYYEKNTACHSGCTNLSDRLIKLAMCTNKEELLEAMRITPSRLETGPGIFTFEQYCSAASAATRCILSEVDGCPYLINFVRTILDYLWDHQLYGTLADVLDLCPGTSYNDLEVGIYRKHETFVKYRYGHCGNDYPVNHQVDNEPSGISKTVLIAISVGTISGIILITAIVLVIFRKPIKKLVKNRKNDSTTQFESKVPVQSSTADL